MGELMKQIPSTIDGFPNRTQEYSAPLCVFSIFPDEKFLESDCSVTALPAASITPVFSCTLGRWNDQISLMLSLVSFATNKNEHAFLKTTSPRLLRELSGKSRCEFIIFLIVIPLLSWLQLSALCLS